LIKIIRYGQKFYFAVLLTASSIAIFLVLVTQNPIGRRFREIATGSLSIVNQEKFTQGDYFNGLQFRLLQFRFVRDILDETHNWILGLGIGNTQNHLDNKYISTGMYIGKNSDDRGFLGYNTQNQFLQCLLELGIIGLTIFVFTCFSLGRTIFKRESIYLRYVFVLLLLFSTIDTPLETQYGLILFTFFPLFLSRLDLK
jgi:O-antigen ligase